MLFYLTAGVLRVAPLAEWSVRLPNVTLALLNIWLIHLVGRRLFPDPWYGVAAALLLALTPVHFFFARLAQDYFLALTFALLWLYCLLRYLQTEKLWLATAMGLALGAGIYTHISSWVTMPFYFVLTSVVLVVRGKQWRAHGALLGGFAVAMLPLLIFLSYRPTVLQDMFKNYGVVTTVNLAERVTIYWEYFNPSYLFFSGGADPMWATRRAGVFLLAMAVLLPCGIWSIVRTARPCLASSFWRVSSSHLSRSSRRCRRRRTMPRRVTCSSRRLAHSSAPWGSSFSRAARSSSTRVPRRYSC